MVTSPAIPGSTHFVIDFSQLRIIPSKCLLHGIEELSLRLGYMHLAQFELASMFGVFWYNSIRIFQDASGSFSNLIRLQEKRD